MEGNLNFGSITIYDKEITMKDIFSTEITDHFLERNQRLNIYNQFLKNLYIETAFLVDKHHKSGTEIHCVTNKGFIFILNKNKYERFHKGFITILAARPNQIKRLYDSCNLPYNKKIIEFCLKNKKNNLNKK